MNHSPAWGERIDEGWLNEQENGIEAPTPFRNEVGGREVH